MDARSRDLLAALLLSRPQAEVEPSSMGARVFTNV